MNTPKRINPRFQHNVSLEEHSAELQKNHLLASLPFEERRYWTPDLELIYVAQKKILCEPSQKPTCMFFPTSAIVSLMYVTLDGASSEIAVIGNDGAVGMSLFMTDSHTLHQSLVHSSGKGFRLSAAATKNVLKRGGPMLETLLSYSQKFIVQVTQNSASNRHYSIEQRLSRRLLLSLDRGSSNDLKLTHELLANILGIRRESVTEAALKLQQSGAIRYSRGNITILDRNKLEQSCTECYTGLDDDHHQQAYG